jgi:hypothetical protein
MVGWMKRGALVLMIRMAAEAVQNCRLQRLRLDIKMEYDDHESSDLLPTGLFSSIPDYDELLEAFACNTTLTDVHLSNYILDSCDSKKLYFYVKRNEEFQKIISELIVHGTDRNDQSNDDGDTNACKVSDCDYLHGHNRGGSVSTIPLGLWPHILEAAHKQFVDESMLFQLFSLQPVVLLFSGREERDISP